MTNLLSETIEHLSDNGKAPDDVRWIAVIGSTHTDGRDPVGTWADFSSYAKDFDYDSGYGGNEVEGKLVIAGDDWWLERGEYDGSEWWEFKTMPKRPENGHELRREDLKERW